MKGLTYSLEKAAGTYARMMSGSAQFRAFLKIWTSPTTQSAR
jgi:hypothetical protein